jgi:hypothetical protein
MRCLTLSVLLGSLCGLIPGCVPPLAWPDGLLGGSGAGSDGDVSQAALNYKGTLSGSVADISTTAGLAGVEAGRTVPLSARVFNAIAWVTDLDGNRLKDANGVEYPNFAIDPDGPFEFGDLPVGVDFAVHIDLDGDGVADLFSIVNIPKDAGSDTGSLDGAMVDPLSTLTGAKLARMLAEHGINAQEFALSLSGLIGRTRDAYENLFEDAGIEDQIDLNQILGLSPTQLGQLFAELIPLAAQRGMRMAESNIDLAVADDVQGIVVAVAKIVIEGGFVIADNPDGIDLSFLADLPHVQTMTVQQFEELMGSSGSGGTGGDGGTPAQSARQPAQGQEPTLYLSTLAEVDRNYVNAGDENEPMQTKPVFGEHMLIKIAEVYLAGKTVSLGDLYELMVDADVGLGARLTYSKPAGPNRRPLDVFETPDGTGVEKDTWALSEQLSAVMSAGSDPEMMTREIPEARRILREFLAGTAEPSFERMFGGFLMGRVPSAEEFAAFIRNRRAHLPFSRSGPSQWFVVADGDPFRDANAKAITVDVETNTDGKVTRVSYDASGNGKYYLGHGPLTEAGMQAELIRRSNGRLVHDHHGEPQLLEMSDATVFQSVGGQSFFEAFSETGVDYPGAPALRIPNYDFDPELPPDPETNPPDWEAYVLMTEHGADGTPVRVVYADGVATFNSAGRYYLLFDERTQGEGLFALIAETGELLQRTPGDWETRVLVRTADVQGLDLEPENFTHVFGIEMANPGYDPEGAPYYDDINDNDAEDAGEPTFAEHLFLEDASDWRSTWVEKYYRRADNNGFPKSDQINWESDTPALLSGVALVPRNFKPRLNAYLFGRPNTAINLLLAFSPPEFFNGTQALNRDTRINPLMAVAIIDLVFEQMMNVEATVDWDGPGGMPAHEELVQAWFFIAPLDDPVALIADSFVDVAR